MQCVVVGVEVDFGRQVGSEDFVLKLALLQHHTTIHEGIDADIEVLLFDFELEQLDAHFNVGVGESVSEDAVAHDATERVAAAKSFVKNSLIVELVHVSVLVESALAGEQQLRSQAVCEDEFAVDDGQILSPSGVEAQVVELRLVAESACVGEECVGVDAFARILLTVAGVEGQTAVNVGVETAVGFVGRDESVDEIFVVKCRYVGQLLVVVLAFVEHFEINAVDGVVEQSDAAVPIPVAGDIVLEIYVEFKEVAFHLIVGAGAVGVGSVVGPVGMIGGLVAVEAVEVAHCVGQIGNIHAGTVAGKEVL